MSAEAIGAIAGMVGMLVGVAASWGAMRSTVATLRADVETLTERLGPLVRLGAIVEGLEREVQRRRDEDHRSANEHHAVRLQVERLSGRLEALERLVERSHNHRDLSGRVASDVG